jgi:hypothetical protein
MSTTPRCARFHFHGNSFAVSTLYYTVNELDGLRRDTKQSGRPGRSHINLKNMYLKIRIRYITAIYAYTCICTGTPITISRTLPFLGNERNLVDTDFVRCIEHFNQFEYVFEENIYTLHICGVFI